MNILEFKRSYGRSIKFVDNGDNLNIYLNTVSDDHGGLRNEMQASTNETALWENIKLDEVGEIVEFLERMLDE